MTTTESRSARFSRRITETYDGLSPADLEYVAEVVYTLDLLDRLRADYAESDLVEQRQGGPRVRPEVVESRLQAQHLASLLRRFPELDDE